jgi:GTPase involved in cell partitioning and DNA repair
MFPSIRSSAYRLVRGGGGGGGAGGAVYAAPARTLRNLFFFKSFKMYA